jgi:hypothetical protein
MIIKRFNDNLLKTFNNNKLNNNIKHNKRNGNETIIIIIT